MEETTRSVGLPSLSTSTQSPTSFLSVSKRCAAGGAAPSPALKEATHASRAVTQSAGAVRTFMDFSPRIECESRPSHEARVVLTIPGTKNRQKKRAIRKLAATRDHVGIPGVSSHEWSPGDEQIRGRRRSRSDHRLWTCPASCRESGGLGERPHSRAPSEVERNSHRTPGGGYCPGADPGSRSRERTRAILKFASASRLARAPASGPGR